MKVHRLLGIGNPLMDMIVNVDLAFLNRFGLRTNQAITSKSEHQELFSTLKTSLKPTYLPGGAAQNTVRVAQWMLQEKDSTGFIGAVGTDWCGEEMSRVLVSEGVSPYYQKTTEKETGSCAVLVYEKDRALVSNPAAARLYRISHLKSIWTTVQSAEMYYFTSFFFRSSRESIWEIVHHATSIRKPIAYNLGSTVLIELFRDLIISLFPVLDYVFCNESEALHFSKLIGNRSSDLKEIVLEIANYPKSTSGSRTVVITRGAKDTVVARDGRVGFYPVEKVDQGEIVDTNGAGDAFAGAFLAAQIRKKDLNTSVRAANYAAAEIIKRVGCTLPKDVPRLRL